MNIPLYLGSIFDSLCKERPYSRHVKISLHQAVVQRNNLNDCNCYFLEKMQLFARWMPSYTTKSLPIHWSKCFAPLLSIKQYISTPVFLLWSCCAFPSTLTGLVFQSITIRYFVINHFFCISIILYTLRRPVEFNRSISSILHYAYVKIVVSFNMQRQHRCILIFHSEMG